MDTIHFATFFVALLSSILSGIASGGGGFVMAPYWLLAGLTPAQGATTGSFMALGMTTSSLAAFKGSGHHPRNKKLLIILLITTVFASVLGSYIMPKLDVSSYRVGLAILTLVSLPLLFVKNMDVKGMPQYKRLGYFISIVLIVIGSVTTSSAFSILLTLAIMNFFNISVFQTTALRRMLGVAQSLILFTGLTLQGHFLWEHSLMAILGGIIGSYVGTKYVLKKGEAFAKYMLAFMSMVGAFALLI